MCPRARSARAQLKNIDLDIPRDALVVFTGVSGSGKSSLAFGTLYAEAQRRYLESVSPYARRLFHQMAVPEVDEIDGLPPAVALQQQRGSPTTRSSVGSVTTLSNLLRMLYSRAGDYPRHQPHLDAEAFSPNTPAGACPRCHGLGRVYEVTERSMVPDDSQEHSRAGHCRLAARLAWQNLRDMLITLGYDVDRPWRELPKKDRDWILFTDEQPVVPVYIGYDADEARRAIKRKEEPSYRGNFSSARRYVLHTFATTESASIKKRVSRYMVSTECPLCHGKRLRREVAVGQVRRLRYRRHLQAAAQPGSPTLLRPYAEATAAGPDQAVGAASGEGGGGAADRRGSRSAGSRFCSTSGSAISRWSAVRRRCRRANCSACDWPPRCAPICSASFMCSTSPPPDFIPRTPRRC